MKEPKEIDRLRVRIGQRCDVCGAMFAKKHPKSIELICPRCRQMKGADDEND